MGRLTHCITIVLAILMIGDAHTSAKPVRPAIRIWNIYTGELLPVDIAPESTVGDLKEQIGHLTHRELPTKILMIEKEHIEKMFENARDQSRGEPIERIKLDNPKSSGLPDELVFTSDVMGVLSKGDFGLVYFPGALTKTLEEIEADKAEKMAEREQLLAEKAALLARVAKLEESIKGIQHDLAYVGM